MGKPWFNPKRYGYGAGLPCSWEGWLVMATSVAIICPGVVALRGVHWKLGVALILADLFVLIVIVTAKTRGGWRWRWGQD